MNKQYISDSTIINGPVNVARLEGTIDDVKKVIYIFFDLHYDLRNQGFKHEGIGKDIHYYISNFMNEYTDNKLTNSTLIYDIFFELRKYDIIENNDFMKKSYIREFLDLFNIDEYPNFRQHYMDVRDIMNFADLTIHIQPKLSYTLNDIIRIKTGFNLIHKILNVHYDILNGTIIDATKDEYNLFIKLTTKYTNIHVKDKLSYFVNNLKKYYVTLLEYIIIIEKIINDSINNYNINSRTKTTRFDDVLNINITEYGYINSYYIDLKINNECQYFKLLFDRIGVCWTDLYFLRRILDKKYITNIVTYMGGSHCANTIHVLVNTFNFKITNIYRKENDIKYINSYLKKLDPFNIYNEHILRTIFAYYNDSVRQFVDIKGFPTNFS